MIAGASRSRVLDVLFGLGSGALEVLRGFFGAGREHPPPLPARHLPGANRQPDHEHDPEGNPGCRKDERRQPGREDGGQPEHRAHVYEGEGGQKGDCCHEGRGDVASRSADLGHVSGGGKLRLAEGEDAQVAPELDEQVGYGLVLVLLRPFVVSRGGGRVRRLGHELRLTQG